MTGLTSDVRDSVSRGDAFDARASRAWPEAFGVRLALGDALSVAVAMSTAYVVRFDPGAGARVYGSFSPSYLAVSLGLALAWLLALEAAHTRDRRVVGAGPGEYARVFSGTWRVFALVAIAAYLLKMDIGRGYLAIAAPLGLGLLLAERYAWRRWLHRRRLRGEYKSGIVVVGRRDKAARLIRDLRGSPGSAYVVIGVCVPDGDVRRGEEVAGVPVLGRMVDTARVARAAGASAVAVSGSDAVTSEVVHQLGWDLEGSGIDLALTLALLDVAGPRVMLSPVNDLPLMYVDEPRFTGAKYVVKSTADWSVGLLLTILLLPVLLVCAVLVKTTSRGPVLYTQQRVGKDGRHFRMVKFRSMRQDAHALLADVLAAEGVADVGPFYKPRHDPRVTKVGHLLRKYSLDELPQLFNVLSGTMSLVGPRPQIDAEVALYDRRARRRLLVKPGLTGLWQISGRSDLSPDDAIRLDVRYVENWTVFGDLLILARTAKVVLGGDGAY